MKIAGPGEVEQQLQLLLGGVPRDVDVRQPLVHHLGPQAVEVVDHRGDGPFVAGDELGGQDHQVAGLDVDLLVGLHGDAGQGAQGLSLAAGGDDDGPGGGQPLQVPHGDLQAGGDVQVAQFLGQPGVGHHGLAVEQHLAPELGGDVDDLLHPVDVGGKGRDDHPAGRLPDEALQGDADLPLGNRVAGPLGVGGVGHQGQDARFAVVGKAVQVHGAAGNRGLVDLEIAGMDQEALGGAHHEPDAVHDGMAHPDELEFKRPQGQRLPGDDLPQVGVRPAGRAPGAFPGAGPGSGGCRRPARGFP